VQSIAVQPLSINTFSGTTLASTILSLSDSVLGGT
jgi:hypothetical protein